MAPRGVGVRVIWWFTEIIFAVSLVARSRSLRARGAAQYSPSWFGVFAEDESTFDDNGQAQVSKGHIDVLDGWDPPAQDDVDGAGAFAAQTFHESPSAGFQDAWQAHSPSVGGSVAGNRDATENSWRHLPGNWDRQGWVQDYTIESDGYGNGPQPAEWFDAKVANLDGFGRQAVPSAHNGRKFDTSTWVERATNVSFGCDSAGCEASGLLTAFSVESEIGEDCKLNVYVHATDYAGEDKVIEYTLLNQLVADTDCKPNVTSCSGTNDFFYPCLSEYPVDDAMSEGTLNVTMKNSLAVDDCAYDGLYLSAMATVTCMVKMVDSGSSFLQLLPPSETPTSFLARRGSRDQHKAA
mmetsp:Transcript_53537/g.143207  ORF Transcript_53537/g.143207 Transcript_53537/m.143207 type:complete len:352 (-) Transcript_53537:259-1314(-)